MRKLLLFLFAAASLLTVFYLRSNTASALSNQFLDPGKRAAFAPDANAAAVRFTVEDTDAVSVPSATVKWFVPKTDGSNQTLYLRGFCTQSQAYVEFQTRDNATDGWVGAVGIFANYAGPFTYACVGPDLVIGGIPRSLFQDQWTAAGSGVSKYVSYDVALIRVTLANGTGAGNINQFVAESADGLTAITQAEIGTASKSPAEPAQWAAFAILGDKTNQLGYNITFTFVVDCEADFTTPFYMHWRDADQGQTYGRDVFWILNDDTTGTEVTRTNPGPVANEMGGTNEHRSKAVGLQQNHTYSWTFVNMNHLNTLHVWMPYSEFNTRVGACPKPLSDPPVGTVGGDCNAISGTALDYDSLGSNLTVRLYTGGNSTTGTYAGDFPANGGGHSFSIATPAAAKSAGGSSVYAYAMGVNSAGTPDGFTYIASSGIPACSTNTTVSGRFFDSDDSTISYGGIAVITCVAAGTPGYVAPVTDGAGNFSFVIPSGTPFCIRAGSWPMFADSAAIRPQYEAYNGCGPYNQNTNINCPGSTYECQAAGQLATGGCAPDRNSDAGYNIVFHIPQVQIQGRIANAYNQGQGYSGITITTCVTGVSATTDATGNFRFPVRAGQLFCVRPNGLSAGAVTYNDRPYGEGYASCPAYGAATASPNYCAGSANYECQRAAYNDGPVVCGAGAPVDYDRASDNGYDFAMRYLPQASCNVTSSTSVEAGVPNNFTANFTGNDGGGPNAPPITSATGNYTLPGVGGGTGSHGALNPRGSDVPITMAPASYTIASPASYTLTGTMTFVGDGLSSSATCPTVTIKVSTYPYVKAYGSDVVAGGGFGTGTCTNGTGGVYGFTKGVGVSMSGASAQFGVMSLLAINQFYSASQRTATPIPGKGLSFANNGGGSDPTYGGDFDGTGGAAGFCYGDYYTGTQYGTPANRGSIVAAVASAATGSSNQFSVNSMGGSDVVVPVGKQVAVYVDGNIYIDHNISLAAGATSQSTIPYFALIVKGNIYIAPGVTRLDGLYVAQPHSLASPTDGRIYTCAPGAGSTYAASALYDACKGQPLAVNGALIAQQVRFLRTVNSLKDATAREVPNFADGSGGTTKAAEVINYTPELYIANSPLRDPNAVPGAAKYGNYDAVYSLPPVF